MSLKYEQNFMHYFILDLKISLPENNTLKKTRQVLNSQRNLSHLCGLRAFGGYEVFLFLAIFPNCFAEDDFPGHAIYQNTHNFWDGQIFILYYRGFKVIQMAKILQFFCVISIKE